jgi:deazaflavin-dependent oxidoreductase (nitroreductase family)
MRGRTRRGFLWALRHTLNGLTTRAATSGRGPFALARHVGRRSGRAYETPLILAPVPGGFVAELTYGPDVDWYRNIEAAGRCTVVHRGTEYAIDRIAPSSVEQGARYPRTGGSAVAPAYRGRGVGMTRTWRRPGAVDRTR